MKAVFFILNDSARLTELLSALNLAGIKGTTIFNAGGMGAELSKIDDFNQNFGVFRRFIQGTRQEHKVLMFIIQDEMIDTIISAIEGVIGSIEDEGNGLLFSTPIDFVRGLKF